ncbi:hypothetical protein DKT68_15285 [Micromonospora acroterricola]|uniref:Uncharacterized protein n=1 Tax=Micromonospora acroterricola TaxID=2202421 RepID=A0A317D146_9ACTN|nr:hypothetical protein [Micromonospora acroterricola]PWR08578.1 hypothetical protein DKT68_15285 [Micromonospora acroterricola]
MTRRRFPDSADRLAYQLLPNNTLGVASQLDAVVYDALTGPELADIATDPDGDPIPGSTVKVDVTSGLPDFLGPDDDRDVVYVSVNGGPRYPVAAKVVDRVVELAGQLDTALDDAAADASAKANAAQAAAVAAATAVSLPRQPGKNLFDKATAVAGQFWNGVGSTTIALATWSASPKYPVMPGQTYSISNCRNYETFNADGTPKIHTNNASEGPVTFTIPSGAAFLAFTVASSKVDAAQLELGSPTAYEPFGYVVDRQLAGGRYLADAAANVTALQRAAGVSVYRSGNSLLVRSPFDATRDILMPWNLAYGEESQAAPADVTNPNVVLVPSVTADDLVWPTIATGTAIHNAPDDNAPINVQWCYIGGNHGWTAWNVTMAGHGKATADVGSTWSDGVRTFTLLAVVSSSVLLFAGPYTVSSGVVSSPSAAPGAALTHVSGATNTTAVPISGGVAVTQIHPSSYDHTATAALDGRQVATGKAAGQVLTISESYLIASYKGMVDWAQSHVGTPVLANLSSVPALARVSNTYRITAAQVVVAQRVTAVEKTIVNMGVTQAFPLTLPSGGTRRQFMPGVGAAGGVNFSTFADLATVTGTTDIGPAAYLSPLVPAASMTQWAYDSTGAAQYGLAMGLLPTADGHPSQRLKNAATKGWFIAPTTKKSYPQLAWAKTLNAGESLSGTAYRRYLAPPFGPTELVVSDGADTWAIIERTDTVTDARMPAPELLGQRLVPAWVPTAVTADRVTGSGITYSVPSGPGYTVLRATAEPPRFETLAGATAGAGSYFITQQGLVSAQAYTGGFQTQYFWQMYLPEPVWVDQAVFEVTVVGTGVIRHGVFFHDPATGLPVQSGPLVDFGAVDVTSIGVKTSTPSAPVLLPAGVHWYSQAWQGTNTTAPTVRVVNGPPGVGPLNIGTTTVLMSGSRMGYFAAGVAGAFGAVALSASSAHQLFAPRLAYRRA